MMVGIAPESLSHYVDQAIQKSFKRSTYNGIPIAGEANVAKLHGCTWSKNLAAWSFCTTILAIRPPKEYL